MIFEEALRRPSAAILRTVENLQRFGHANFGQHAHIEIYRTSSADAMDRYRRTLNSMPAKIEAEPPSATMIKKAYVSWEMERSTVGAKVRQRHVGEVHPEVREMIEDWIAAGKPYPSSGGIYYTVPNKSFEKVEALQKQEELRDAILHLGLTDEWLRLWDMYLPLRYEVSAMMLSHLQSGTDPEAFDRKNKMAGTGLQLRGKRALRSDLVNMAKELDFLLPYSFFMGVAFAATQIAELPPKDVWVIRVFDQRIKGAIASRSDMDVLSADFDGKYLTIEGVAQTRQAGSDATGVLSNSHTEKKLLQASVSEQIMREFRTAGVEYPFTKKELLLNIWGADAKQFPNKPYVIGQDIGLIEPVKAGADNLFSRAFTSMANKWVPNMLSGSGWTMIVYTVFHNHFRSLLQPGEEILCLGDDTNVLAYESTEDVFYPYIKVKGTNAEQNTKKILGMYSAFALQDDPEGRLPALVGVVPRVIKTVSSATKISSRWGEQLSDLKPRGRMEISQDEKTLRAIARDLPILKPYLHWKGRRSELAARLRADWTHITADTWEILISYMDEVEHRILRTEDSE